MGRDADPAVEAAFVVAVGGELQGFGFGHVPSLAQRRGARKPPALRAAALVWGAGKPSGGGSADVGARTVAVLHPAAVADGLVVPAGDGAVRAGGVDLRAVDVALGGVVGAADRGLQRLVGDAGGQGRTAIAVGAQVAHVVEVAHCRGVGEGVALGLQAHLVGDHPAHVHGRIHLGGSGASGQAEGGGGDQGGLEHLEVSGLSGRGRAA